MRIIGTRGVVEEISLALVQSKLGGMTLHALRA